MEEVKEYLVKAGIPKRLKGFDYLTFVICFSQSHPYCSMREACISAAESSGATEKSISSSIVYALSYAYGNSKVRPKDFVNQAVFELGAQGGTL